MSKIFLVGAGEGEFDVNTAPKLEVDPSDFSPDSTPPEGMPVQAFQALVRLVGLVKAVEKYVEVSAVYNYVLGLFPPVLYVNKPERLDGAAEDVELSVDLSMLLAALLLTCSPCFAVDCDFLPTARLSVSDDLVDTKTGAQVSEVRYLPGDGSRDCTRAIYLFKRDLEHGDIELLGSYNIETGQFEDTEGAEVEVDETVAKFINRKDWFEDVVLQQKDESDRPVADTAHC